MERGVARMNKKSRNKLLIVTAVIVAAISVLAWYSLSQPGSLAYFKTVKQIQADKSLVGQSIRVGGKVLPKTTTNGANGLKFQIGDAGHKMWVTYKGAMPSSFGDNVQVIAEGQLRNQQLLEASSLVTKCPSKFKSKQIGDAK